MHYFAARPPASDNQPLLDARCTYSKQCTESNADWLFAFIRGPYPVGRLLFANLGVNLAGTHQTKRMHPDAEPKFYSVSNFWMNCLQFAGALILAPFRFLLGLLGIALTSPEDAAANNAAKKLAENNARMDALEAQAPSKSDGIAARYRPDPGGVVKASVEAKAAGKPVDEYALTHLPPAWRAWVLRLKRDEAANIKCFTAEDFAGHLSGRDPLNCMPARLDDAARATVLVEFNRAHEARVKAEQAERLEAQRASPSPANRNDEPAPSRAMGF